MTHSGDTLVSPEDFMTHGILLTMPVVGAMDMAGTGGTDGTASTTLTTQASTQDITMAISLTMAMNLQEEM